MNELPIFSNLLQTQEPTAHCSQAQIRKSFISWDWLEPVLVEGRRCHMAGNGWLQWCHTDCNFYGWM